MDGDLSAERIEFAPMLNVWSSLAPVVAQIIRRHPEAARRLVLAPENATHAIAAFLHSRLAGAVNTELLAHALATQDARDLLAEAVAVPHPRLFGLLRRLGPVTQSLAFYRELNYELGQPTAGVLFEAPYISAHTIQIARQIGIDPVLLAARRAIGEDEILLRHLASLLGLLRSLGIANHIERLPSGSGVQAIFRRIKMDLRAAKPPSTPFRIHDGWEQVSDVGQLIRIGELLKNCLSILAGDGTRHIRSFLTGASAFLVHQGSSTMLVSLDRLGPKTWSIGEFGSTSADEFEDEEKQEAMNDVRACMMQTGDLLLFVNPFTALVELGWRARR